MDLFITDRDSPVKTYYLYVKTHQVTGLKYLGYTGKKDPYKYSGSGKYWKNHLEVYGKHINTEILLETNSLTEIETTGRYFSELWRVVESHEWANLKPEEGQGGAFKLAPESIAKRLETRKKNGTRPSDPEIIAKHLETKRQNGTLNTSTPESIAKTMETKRQNGTLNTITPESIAKQLETRRQNGTLNTSTLESIAKGLKTREQNGTFNTITPESIAKQLETKRQNGTQPSNPEIIAKQLKTKERNGSLYATCPHCGKTGNLGAMHKWHFDNCKLLKL